MANINCVPVGANDFSENILNKTASFDYGVDYVVNSGSGLVELEAVKQNGTNPFVFKGLNSLKVTNSAYKTTDLVFSSPSGVDKVDVNVLTNCFISLYIFNPSNETINTNLKLEVFMSGSPSDVYYFPLTDTTTPYNNWSRIGQNITLEVGFTYTFRWTLEKDLTSVSTSRTIYIDGLCIQKLNQNSLGVQPYQMPKDATLLTGWQSRVDTVNTQVIPATTSTIVPITTGLEGNGNVKLLDANSKIVPLKLGDLISADFAFTVTTPAGTDNYVNVAFVVNGLVYRSVTFPLVKGVGLEENCSVSFSLPVGSAFYTNGGTFQVYASTGVTIKNRYIAVSLQHKGI